MIFTLFGDLKFDLARDLSLSTAPQTVISLFGDLELAVPPDTQVKLAGVTLFGDSRVKVSGGYGPTLNIRFFSLFGDLKIVEGKAIAVPIQHPAVEGARFPY